MNRSLLGAVSFLTPYVAIGIAAFCGGIARHLVGVLCARLLPIAFPIGTFLINVSASFLLGWFVGASRENPALSETVRLAVAVGFIGTYSTFSTFAYESNALLQGGALGKAILNVVGSIVAGLVAVRLGIAVGGRA